MKTKLGVGLALAALVVFLARSAFHDPVGKVPVDGFEALRRRTPYGTSRTCSPCHPDHVASWGRTFHKTMTQAAAPGTIRAAFDGSSFQALDVDSRPWRRGERFYLDTLDPGSGVVTTQPILRVTGSRRMQQFETWEGDRYVRLPLAWSIDENRWLHLSETFFHPDGEGFSEPRAVWDLNCIFCHTTKPVPGLDARDRLASGAAQLGIACEACHGPGTEHARRMRSPLRRLAFRISHPVDPTLVNPARLDPLRSIQVCGHCHGQRVPAERGKIREIMERGDPYTPGEDLSRYFEPVTRDTTIGAFSFAPRFWADGSPRLTAYEYQGLLRSPCVKRGTMTCLSCHSMHSGDPHGQMRPDLPGNAICTQCHAGHAGDKLSEHTRHRPDSAGSRCSACHMPSWVYGIMTWHPSHEISSPDPAASRALGKPDACTLCHGGRSRSWAEEWSARYWPRRGASIAESTDRTRPEAPELVRALFAGDVVYRTLAAARLGEPAAEQVPDGAVVALLAELLVDPYPNVRRTARKALALRTGREDLPQALDPVALREAARRTLQAFRGNAPPGWPFTAEGALDRARLEDWKRERQEVSVSIGE